VLSTQSSNKLSDNICSVFGSKFLLTMTQISIPLISSSAVTATADTDDGDSVADTPTESAAAVTVFGGIDGYISRVGEGVGRSDNDRQFLFCNNRSVDIPRIAKVINEVNIDIAVAHWIS
jgi:DNA mismatch repair ATPase MutL